MKYLYLNIILLLTGLMIFSDSQAHGYTEESIVYQDPEFTERMGERNKMVNQIASHFYLPVRDNRVLDALRKVPRHKFVPDDLQDKAYDNTPLPIGYGQTISQPLIVAHMTELLEIDPGDRILEIGTGSGYQAAVLGELTNNVFSIEIVPELARKASMTLAELGYKNVRTKTGNGYEGWEEYAPFDGIIVTCAPEDIPQPLIDQLKPGGVIVIPIGEMNQTQMLVVVRKSTNGKVYQEKRFPVRFVPMIKE